MVATAPQEAVVSGRLRAEARGKFLFSGAAKLRVCGVTYGTFRPDGLGSEFNPVAAERDFRDMAVNGINAIRTYTVPPPWFLDLAAGHGLFVMVGIPWEQHITFLDDRARRHSIEQVVRGAARACTGHQAVLCYAVGNEIPSSIVRWYGRARIEKFLTRLIWRDCRISRENVRCYLRRLAWTAAVTARRSRRMR